MDNHKSVNFFSKLAQKKPDLKATKLFINDQTELDYLFIKQYTTKDTYLLDLGSGSGQTVNKLLSDVKHITAVELFDEFSQFITKSENLVLVKEDIASFMPTENYYDIITMFGLIQYFNATESIKLYEKCFRSLKKNGIMIIKHQFGLTEDVTIDGFSEELQSNYFSQYRTIPNEVKILESIGMSNCTHHDIYPPEANRWKNTHFFAIVAHKI